MKDWLATLHAQLAAGEAIVRVVVAATRGSVPREAGACMLVSAHRQWGTVGGGHLELVATRTARDMLAGPASPARLDRFPLAASLGQCCGGIVELWFQRYEAGDAAALAEALALREAGATPEALAERVSRDPDAARYERFSPATTPLWIFGAGHVGRALVDVLAPLPFDIAWVDSREDAFPECLPAGVRALHSPQPAEEVADMPAGAWALVMTHSHEEDLALCEALLAHDRFGWAGVIGSGPKTRRFRQQLARRGFGEGAFARLTMPIGIEGIRSKEPAAIAVAVAAQLLQLREAGEACVPVAAAARAT
jgi:xanthine dehydrogenase accessory factor